MGGVGFFDLGSLLFLIVETIEKVCKRICTVLKLLIFEWQFGRYGHFTKTKNFFRGFP